MTTWHLVAVSCKTICCFFSSWPIIRKQLWKLLWSLVQFYSFVSLATIIPFILPILVLPLQFFCVTNSLSDLSYFQDYHDTELSRQGREGGRGGGHTNTGGGCKWSRHRLRNRLWRQPLHPRWPRGHAALRLRILRYGNAKWWNLSSDFFWARRLCTRWPTWSDGSVYI